MATERLGNFSDVVTEGWSSVRVEEKRVEQGGWIVNSWRREEGWEDWSVLYTLYSTLFVQVIWASGVFSEQKT